MEKFTVNGKEVDFDPFDLDVMEVYLAALDRVDAERRVKMEKESSVDTLRRVCNVILDFFDDQLGDGQAEALFGRRINAKDIFEGYKDFTGQVNACIRSYAKELNAPQTSLGPVNRAKRRREDRNKQ